MIIFSEPQLKLIRKALMEYRQELLFSGLPTWMKTTVSLTDANAVTERADSCKQLAQAIDEELNKITNEKE